MRSDPLERPAASLQNSHGVAARIQQLAAIVAALATLMVGVTALVVASKAGWGEVAPSFANFIQHGLVSIPQPRPQTVSNASSIDPLLVQALEGNTHQKRDQARQALALAIARSEPRSVDDLVEEVVQSSFYQICLGIAVALRRAPGG